MWPGYLHRCSKNDNLPHDSYICFAEIFMKNLTLDSSKPLEDRKPSHEFTIIFYLQCLVIWWEFLSSLRSPKYLKIPGPAKRK